jgi:hypothetical protein
VKIFAQMSNIDQCAASEGGIVAHHRPPKASIGDREFGNAPAPTQGSVMASTSQLLTSIERPRCSRCQTRMMLERVSPGPIGFEHRLFECPKCDHVEINVISCDPFQSNATGWLAGELRAPN